MEIANLIKEFWNLMKPQSFSELVLNALKYSSLLCFGYMVYKRLPQLTKTVVIYKKNNLNEKLAKALSIFNYKQTFFLPHDLWQLAIHEMGRLPEVYFKREYLIMEDSGVVSIDWVISEESRGKKSINKLMIMVHGLTGGSETTYMREISKDYAARGYKVAIVHNRGISDTPIVTPLVYHAAFTGDIKDSIRYIRNKYPNVPCYALGVSMGANLLTKLFGETHEFDDYILGFVSVSNPLNMLAAVKLNKGTIIDYFIKKRLKAIFSKYKILKNVEGIDFESIKTAKSTTELDNEVTIKIHKSFTSVDDYYTKTSSYYDIKNLRIKSLFINARDDRLSPIKAINLNVCKILI